MALPSRPLGGGVPPAASAPKETVTEDFELPELDFGSLPAVEPEVKSASEEFDELPQPDLSFDEFLSEPPVERAPQRASVNQFTEDFQAAPTPSALPEVDDELPDIDFGSIFEESEAIPESIEPELPSEESLPEAFYDDDFDSLFDEKPEELPEPIAEAMPEPAAEIEEEEDYESLFDSLPEPGADALPAEELPDPAAAPSWDEDFDKFLEDIEEDENGGAAPEQEPEDGFEGDDNYVSTFDEDEAGEQNPENGNERRSGRRGSSRPQGLFGKFSSSLVKNLGAIPIIGRLFRPLAAIAGLFTVILMLLPLIAIPFIIYNIAAAQVPGSSTASGPDSASVSFGDFSYSNGEVVGSLTNTGDVIANIVPTFTVWSYNPLGGGSIFAFDKVGTCEGEEVSADIDETVGVKFACEVETSGIATKASAEASF